MSLSCRNLTRPNPSSSPLRVTSKLKGGVVELVAVMEFTSFDLASLLFMFFWHPAKKEMTIVIKNSSLVALRRLCDFIIEVLNLKNILVIFTSFTIADSWLFSSKKPDYLFPKKYGNSNYTNH